MYIVHSKVRVVLTFLAILYYSFVRPLTTKDYFQTLNKNVWRKDPTKYEKGYKDIYFIKFITFCYLELVLKIIVRFHRKFISLLFL